MLSNKKSVDFGRLLAKFLIAGSVFLWPVENVFAAPNLVLTDSFSSVDGTRTYMDIGGTWNSITDTEVFNGDGFTLTVENTGPDPAYDIRDIPVTVPTGFVLPPGTTVTVTDDDAGIPDCDDMSANASQAGAGLPVTINIFGNNSTVINPGCTYNYAFRLETNTSAIAGTQSLGYVVTYNTINNDSGSAVSTPLHLQSIDVNAGSLSISKTTATTSAIATDVISYDVTVMSNGSGGLFDVRLNDILSSDLNGLTFTVPDPPPGATGPGADDYTFEYLAASETVSLTVEATVTPVLDCPILENSANLSERTGVEFAAVGPVTVPYDFEFTSGLPTSVVTHNAVTSYCELCGDGVISITVQNPTDAPLTDITILEDLQLSGLEYIDGSTTVSSGSLLTPNPSISGSQLTWTSANLSALGSLAGTSSFVITFGVRSTVAENLATADRRILANADFAMSCLAARQSVDSELFEVPIRQPLPTVIKDGRNYDAGQTGYTDPIYGSFNDDVIWRVNVQNAGLANMQALLMNDAIGSNFTISFICPDEGSAEDTALSNGTVGGAGCIAFDPSLDADDPFGNIADPDDVAASSADAFIFYVGRINNLHNLVINDTDISWGCEADSIGGGSITVPASTGGFTPGVVIADTGDLSTTVAPAGLVVTQNVSGSNPAQDLGTKGLITITLNNQTGGSIQSLTVGTDLPAGYVLDETYGDLNGVGTGQPTSATLPAYGATYDGMIDIVTRDDPELDNGNPLDDLDPTFTLSSSTTGPVPDDAQQVDMLRHGDRVSFTFGIVMIEPARYDLVADLDVQPEDTGTGTDPASAITGLNNDVVVNFDSVDPAGLQNQIRNETFTYDSNPEDLDVEILDALFILTNDPGTPLDLPVNVTNNGGHDADDYTVYVTLGQAMTAQLPYPGGCSDVTPPPAITHPLWNKPDYLPPTAAVFACDRGTIAPGATEIFTFTVIKAASSAVDDDLTFRADVVGEIHLFNSTPGTPLPLTFPTTATLLDTTPNKQLANNYTLDAVRSRVLGFNLTKSVLSCAESPDFDIQIGEDCTYHIESGGWFGFITPGFTLIAVENVVVTDDLPNDLGLFGQGFIPFGGTPYNFNNTDEISMIDATGGATTTPLDANDITWSFNATGSGIIIKDEFFRVDLKTRLLNNPVDLAYPVPGGYAPNLHGNISTNIARTSFDAIFNSVAGDVTIVVDDAAGIPGYPVPLVRTVNLTEVEPNLIVTKQVCNESLYGEGTGCTAFADAINDGDTNDSYIYRITLTNEVTTAPVPVRSPAYNIISTDTLGSGISDLMEVVDFTDDLLDNDGDGDIDEADEAFLFASIPNNIIGDGTPAVITVDESYNALLQQVVSGGSIEFYYRVDPDISIAPLQTLTNTVSMSYDSLEGDHGSQNDPWFDNSATAPDDVGRARIYTSIEQSADVTMIPLLAQPKTIVQLSNTPLSGSPSNVSVGEEIRYLLVADLPVANLVDFTIRDELPPGTRCVEGQEVNLDAPPYSLATFVPGGIKPGVCGNTGTHDYVEWKFGDQAVTASLPGDRFYFPVTFIARVENSAITFEGETLTNGGIPIDDPATCTSIGGGGVGVCYRNELGTPVSLDFLPVSVMVREPVIALSKSFLPVINSDAADVLTVTVVAENTGTAAAYNLQVMDNLVGSDMTYIVGSEGGVGTNKPDDVDISVPNRPVFSWDRATNPDYEILPGVANAKTFTFQVRVDTTAQPLETLDNTIEAKWDSLPGQDVALIHEIVPQGIGPDGSLLGLRNGAVPNAGVAPNDYEITATASTSVLPLTITKTDLDLTVVPTIGAHRNFEVVIDLPEGTTENLIVDDQLLVAAGVSYVLSRNASFDVTYTFEDIVSINGLPPAEAVFRGATAGPPTLPLPVDGDSGTITWDIGKVITDEEDDLDAVANTVNPRIIIRYYARPNNDLATNAGGTMQNSATVNYDHGEGGPAPSINDTTAVQTVLEPLLTIDKVVSNFTSAGVRPVAGDVLRYVVTIDNPIGALAATAFDSNIVDTLDDNLLFDSSVAGTPTALLDGSLVTGFVAAPTITAAPASTLTWGRVNADNTLDIPVGSTLVLTYYAVVQTSIEPNVDISNSVVVDWTSLDDTDPSSAYERTGASCPAAPNDYCTGPFVADITANDSNSIIKTVIADTYVAPLGSVRVGDTVTYQLDVNIQQGTTNSVNILDAVPAGLTFVDIVSINGATTAPYASPASGVGSNFSYTPIPAANVPAPGAIGPVFNWSLGTIANDAAGDPTTDTLVIIYRARVTEGILPHLDTLTLTNTADFTYIDGNLNPSPPDARLNDSADIFVLQPIMDVLSKTDRLGRLSPLPVDVATDVMQFRLHTCNTTGLAPAYGLLMTDSLATQLNETSITGPVNGALAPDVYIGGGLVSDGTEYTYIPPSAPARGGSMVFRFNTPIDPGVCVDIDFDMGFYTDFAASSWSNTLVVDEYYSLPPADAQLYPAVGPVTFDMNNLGAMTPDLPEKTMVTPDPAFPEATIGDEVVYRILVPRTPFGAVMYDVNITDTLDPSLVYEVGSASDIGGSSFAITDSTVGNNIDLEIAQIPAGQQALIELRARVDNNLAANAGVNFFNTATYTFANVPSGVPIGGGSDTTASSLTIIEPVLVVLKSVVNTIKPGQPDAGDILRYTVELTASGGAVPGDLFSDAFDVSIADNLSLGLLYIDGSQTVDSGTINLPVIAGDGIITPQSLSWSLAEANADIDVSEGTTVTVTYDVLVLDSVLADQNLSNAVDIQWSSRDGPNVPGGSGEFERDGSGLPLNDYFNLISAFAPLQTTPDSNTIDKSRISDTYNPVSPNDNIVRIGDIVEYQLLINMQEGTSPNFIVQDTLPEGLVFEQTVSINGQTSAPYPAVAPFTHAAIPAAVVVGDPVTGPTTVSWNVGDIINAGDNNITNDDFVIVYRARVLNLALVQANNTPLPNTVDVDYDMASGAAPTKTSSELLDLQQPDLSITKIATPAGGDSVIDANELVTYTVEITNNGTAPAYDTELLDTIPLGLRSPTITMISMSLTSGAPLPAIPLAPVYDPVTGTANWNFDTGTADEYSIPPLDTLQIVYQVQADAGLGAGMTLTNHAQVQFYYSFDNDATPSLGGITGVREIYTPVDFAEAVLTTALPNALLKENPADLDASIGETFTYRITIPEVVQTTALYDVQILDNLTASVADLMYVSATRVSGSQPWTPVNIGTVTDDLVIADITNGIDIPAGEFVEIDITVTLRDSSPPNDAGQPFTNAATYTFNRINGDDTTVSAGLGNTTPVMTVVEPELTLDKRGPAGTVNFLAPIPYTVVVENIGNGPAFDTTIVDQLPDVPDNPPLAGGTCDATPINFDARITTTADEATVIRALVLDTDYTATHTAAPTCELVITTLTDTARVEAGEKLIVSYETTLDIGTQSGAILTNIAGATRWFSLDTAGAGATGEIREYIRTITDGTPGDPNDHQDLFTVTVEAPVLDVQKTVTNVTTGLPGTDATPGDRLRYTVVVTNSGLVDANAVTLSDAVPINATYIADTVTLNGLPVGVPDGGVSPLIAGIDISSSDLPPATPGNGTITVGESATVTFEVLLNPAITSGTVISNQAILDSPSTGAILSDDPAAPGTADPTTTLITSAPLFVVQKVSQDITGDPAILLPGDTLRYTLTVKNIGQEDGVNSLLTDNVPANTTYVANSTRLNSVLVADVAGVSRLAAGMPINAPEDTTEGYLRADTDVAADNVATITFDVLVNATAVSGTVISNQGFFDGSGAGSGVFPQQPSDDPATALVDDPTIDVVGNVPVINVLKTVVLEFDADGDGFVDVGDTLLYTITASNIGAVPATGVVLTDLLPANTTYETGTTRLNGLVVADIGPDSPLFTGLDISSSDLTPPLPAAGAGVLSPANTAVVTFDVVVDAGVLDGTIISNQGFVASNELPIEPSDADGNKANGYQTTDIVVGNTEQLAITKQVIVIGGGAAEPGKQLEYIVQVTNIGAVPARNVIITDVLDSLVMEYDGGLLDGLGTGILFDDITDPDYPTLTADYSAIYGDLPPAAVTELRFRVTLNASLSIGDRVTNTADVEWNMASQTASASVSIDIGGIPGAANINGLVWHDTDFDNVAGAEEALLQDYRVELYRSGLLLANILTNVDGTYSFTGLPPNTDANPYEVRFIAPGATATTATLGTTHSDPAFTDGPQRITRIVAASGDNLQNLNLPRQVNGVIYDSVLRVPVAGIQLTMINQTRSNQLVPEECFGVDSNANQASQVTLADGYYKFDLNFSHSLCAEGDEYVIQVQPPASGFIGTTSVIIPPVVPITGSALDVPICPGNAAIDKITDTAEHCENSASAVPAPVTVGPRDSQTDYNLKFLFADTAGQSTNQIYNNHIPVDSELGDVVAISKVAGKLNVTRSDLVPYTITFNNTLGVPLFDVSIIDNFPAGFKYVTGSARVDGEEIEPQIDGRMLTWPAMNVGIDESRVIKLLLIVGSGVGEGEYVNSAWAINNLTGDELSGVATATVRVIPDPTFDCTDIIGKVFDDKNLNAYQDDGERGLPGVQVATARGLRVTTDSHGRFHITCAIVASEVRGSNFIMKLDDRTLPSGYRVTTENPRVQRATRGKMLKFNFGTAIHRVVRLDLADGVFEKGSTELRPQWRSRIDLLINELQKEGSILRLSYLAENETEDEVDDRLDAIEDLVSDRWEDLDCCYKLTIETEVFWRKGSPSAGREFAE